MVLIVLGLALFVGFCHGAPSSGRIIGGDPTTIQRYPSIVQVDFYSGGNFWNQNCGGNIVTKYVVISAAHCFVDEDRPDMRRIRAGATYRNRDGVIAYISRILNHPDFDKATFMDADINIVRLSRTLVFGADINFISLIPQNYVIPDNGPVVNAGWGSIGSGPSPVLLDVTVFKVNNEVCLQRYGGNSINTNMICAGVLDVGGKDACGGDSGGPMYYGGVLAGIVSWGRGCASPVYPGVNTRVSVFTQWILENYQI